MNGLLMVVSLNRDRRKKFMQCACVSVGVLHYIS